MIPLIHLSFLANYFYLNHIHSVTFLTCFNEETKVNLLQSMSNKGLSISFSYPSRLEKSYSRRGVAFDISCKNSPSLLASLTKEKAFDAQTEWLILNQANNSIGFFENKGVQLLSNAYSLPDSSVVLAHILDEEDTVIEYYDVYRTSINTDMKFSFLWRQPVSSFTILPAKVRRRNFDGVKLIGGAAILYPNLFNGFSESSTNAEMDTYAKVGVVAMRNIARQYNFSFTLKIFNSYGYLQNGNFTDMSGSLVKEELDFGLSLMMREERMSVIDFAGNLFPLSVTVVRSPLIFKQPSLSSISNIFLLPFHYQVWIASGGLVIICSVFLFVEILVTSRLLLWSKHSFLEILMAIIEGVCLQGSTLELKSAAAKLTILMFSILSFFLFIAYSAKIVALLHLSTSTIQTLKQFTISPMKIGMQDIVYNRMYFQETNDKDVKEFYYKKIYPQGEKVYMPVTDGIMKIRSQFYAYKSETSWAYKVIANTFNENDKCGLTEVNVFVLPMLSIGLPKNSGLREHFSRSVIWQQEIGIFKRTMMIFSPQKPACNKNTLKFTKVLLTDVKPAFLIFLYGVLVGFTVLLLEILNKILSCNFFKQK